MVPGEPTRSGERAAENPKRQAPGPLPVLRAPDELPQYSEVPSRGLSYLAEMAQSTHSWRRHDVGEICRDLTATPTDAPPDLTFLARSRKPRLRNPLR